MTGIWHRIPFIRILFPFILGIIVAINIRTFPGIVCCTLCAVSAFSLFYWIKTWSRDLRYQWVAGVLLATTAFFFGMLRVDQSIDKLRAGFYGNYLQQGELAMVQITAPPVRKTNSIKLEVDVLAIGDSSSVQPTSGHTLLYLQPTTEALELAYGNRLIIRNEFNEIATPQNPHEFHYKKYLSFHNIYHQAYLTDGKWRRVEGDYGSTFYWAIYHVRSLFLGIINRYIKDADAQSVASALIIGYKDDLDKDLKQSYAATGAMHVLAVSGLHVGIIFLLLQQILKPLARNRVFKKMVIPALLFLAIWIYAVLTGLSPSVVRATTMFSFIIFGSALDRGLNIYSSIAVSAFFLLAWNPYLLTEIGFLLSYSAVLGIVYIQPKLYRKLYFPNKVMDKIWAITCVSIAAQIGTLPLGLMYFHQFPTYFFFSNLIVIPAATLILLGGIALLAFAWLPPIAQFIGAGLDYLIQLLNFLIRLIENIPAALISGIHIEVWEAYLLYVAIVFFIWWLVQVRVKQLLIALTATSLLMISISWRTVENKTTSELVVYAINGHTSVECIDGHRSILIADTTLMNDPEKVMFHMRHNWWAHGIRDRLIVPWSKVGDTTLTTGFAAINGRLLQFRNKLVGFYNEAFNQTTGNPPIPLDVILVTQTSKFSAAHLALNFGQPLIVFDKSAPSWKIEKWKEDCNQRGLPYYDLNEMGALVIRVEGKMRKF